MPIRLTALDAADPQSGIGSLLMAGDRTGRGSVNDLALADFHDFSYLFNSAEIVGNAPGIDIPVIPDTPADFPSQPGPLDTINGFSLPHYTTSLEPFYRQLVGDERQLNPLTATTGTLETATPNRTSTESGAIDPQVAANGVADGIVLTANTASTSFTQPPDANDLGSPMPIRLLVTQTTAVRGNLTIVGTGWNDERLSDTVYFDGTDTTQSTSKFFKTITTATANVGMTIDIGGDATRRYRAVFRGNGPPQKATYGMDVYIRKGAAPNTYREVYVNGMSFSFSREGAIALAIACIGKRPQTNQFIDGMPTEGTPSAIANVAKVERKSTTGWQCGLFYTPPGGDPLRLPVVDASFEMNNNLTFSPTVTGRRTPGGVLQAVRNVTLTGNMEYREEDRTLVADVLGDEFLEGVYLEVLSATNGFPSLTRYHFGRSQFTNLPDAPVSEAGQINRPMAMKMVPFGDLPDLWIEQWTLTPRPLAALTL